MRLIRLVSVTTAALAALSCNSVSGFAPPTTNLVSNRILTKGSHASFIGKSFPSRDYLQRGCSTTTGRAMWIEGTEMLSSWNSDLLLSFVDQGQNLAGILFQASLLPYLVFLYFLAFRGNRLPALSNFGFQFLLIFVLSTIPAGIISKSNYGLSLANVDWLHGSSEALLTITNILIVAGFLASSSSKKETFEAYDGNEIDNDEYEYEEVSVFQSSPQALALTAAGLFAFTCLTGPTLFGPHTAFLFGVGNLSSEFTNNLSWVMHYEPSNALSIPTWIIHFSSVYEWLLAMGLVWQFSKRAQNDKWKGLTWAMLPLHASGISACVYHVFYNEFQYLVSTQAALTFVGNCACAYAAYRIATSNGWTLSDALLEVSILPRSNTSPIGIVADNLAAKPLLDAAPSDRADTSNLVLKVLGSTIASSYLIKYGELALDAPFDTSNTFPATALLILIPSLTAIYYYNRSVEDGNFETNLSFDDVKKYGVAGTVAYVLTELAFWAVALPFASAALYRSTGHWPDLINDTADRATVLGFIFAGANVARLLVPLRLGAALALAPWVDRNIISKPGAIELKQPE